VAAAAAELSTVVHRAPRTFGIARTRWTLTDLGRAVPWMRDLHITTIHRLLDRFDLHYKRGRAYVHSPDLLYDTKLAWIDAARDMATTNPDTYTFLYQDEMTYYRRPTLARGYAATGEDGPRADQGWGHNTKRRVIGSLDVVTGRLFSWQRSCADHGTLIRYYQALEAQYPKAVTIFLAQDHWPVPDHPAVAAALAKTKIPVLWLPTYAPWTNPIEKVWRKLYQEVLHLHPWRDDWTGLTSAVQIWLDGWVNGSMDLLRYVGLHPD
jgi:DDE superfamily endonuclease